MKIIMGLDPGSQKTGFGVIQTGASVQMVACGVIDVPRSLSFSEKLVYLQEAIGRIIEKYQPESVVVEKIFFGKNADSAFKLGHVRGVCLAQVAQAQKQLKEYAARTVKKAITGHGGASKQHVQLVVREILRLKNESLREDASDALALALSYMYKEKAESIQNQAIAENVQNQTKVRAVARSVQNQTKTKSKTMAGSVQNQTKVRAVARSVQNQTKTKSKTMAGRGT